MCKRVFMSTVIVPGVCVLVYMGGGHLNERPGNLMTEWIILCHGPLVPPSHTQTLLFLHTVCPGNYTRLFSLPESTFRYHLNLN